MLEYLSEKFPLDQQIFFMCKYSLGFIGYDPEMKKTFWLEMWALFNFCVLGYCCAVECYYGVYFLSINPILSIDAFSPMATSTMSLIKMTYIWFNRKKFSNIMNHIRKIADSQNSQEKLVVKRHYFTFATRMVYFNFFFSFATTACFSVRPLVSNAIRIINGKTYEFDLPFKMMFPDNWLVMPLYPLTYLITVWYGCITPFSFVGSDGLFFSFCLNLSALLKTLQIDVRDILADNSNMTSLQRRQHLKEIIERYDEIADIVKSLSKIYAYVTLGHFVTTSLIIGTGVIAILFFSGFTVFLYILYAVAVTSQTALYCYGGNEVMVCSEEVSKVAYCSDWYAHDITVQKMILILILRAQRPLDIKVPFFSPSLPVFTSIMRFTGSVIALTKSIL